MEASNPPRISSDAQSRRQQGRVSRCRSAKADTRVQKDPVRPELADELRRGVILLHREKDAAYGNAWKRRGEVISILYGSRDRASGVHHRRSRLFPAVIDLLVYCLKYEISRGHRSRCRTPLPACEYLVRPYSDSSSAVGELLARLGMAALGMCATSVQDAIRDVIGGFAVYSTAFNSRANARCNCAPRLRAGACRTPSDQGHSPECDAFRSCAADPGT